jgi:2-(1,2-epoxy-1,2-dihydrophenyl)acetyl-CoA isomerase
MTEAVIIDFDGGIATIRLVEPETRNALSPAIKAVLEARVPLLTIDPAVRCIVITGTANAFCAGGDLRSLGKQEAPAESRDRMHRSHVWLERLLDCEKPVITAVNGPAVGAGFGLALAGDIVIAADSAWFMAGFTAVGVAADYALGRTLPRAIGSVRAKEILLTGRKVDAAEALAIGLVARLVPAAELEAATVALARRLADGPTLAIGLTKRLVDAGFDGSAAAYLEREALAQSIAFGSSDRREGVAAFLAKRKPVFTGS